MHPMKSLRSCSTALVVGLALCGAASSANAALDTSWFSLSFTEPTGTAAATDDIDVYLTLSLSTDATEGLAYDGSAGAPWGLDGLLPAQGYSAVTGSWHDFASYEFAYIGYWFGCSGTFTDNACPGSSTTYDFSWGSSPDSLALAPGESYTYRMGSFTPNGGAAPAGVYTFYHATFSVFIQGLDADGNSLSADFALAETPWDGDGFVREVSAIPEPGTYALMLAGLGLVGAAARRRCRR